LAKRSNSGPGWIEVEAMMRSIQSATEGVISLTVLPQGRGLTGGLRVALAWSPSMENVNGQDDIVLSESHWPCQHGCTLPAHVFAGLCTMDLTLDQMGRAGTLPKA
jgi:hypothetical protein